MLKLSHLAGAALLLFSTSILHAQAIGPVDDTRDLQPPKWFLQLNDLENQEMRAKLQLLFEEVSLIPLPLEALAPPAVATPASQPSTQPARPTTQPIHPKIKSLIDQLGDDNPPPPDQPLPPPPKLAHKAPPAPRTAPTHDTPQI